MLLLKPRVVYLLTPTSNHNAPVPTGWDHQLYIFWLLHQTTTVGSPCRVARLLYIFWLLHQTTTFLSTASVEIQLYIFWLLHQTTTRCTKDSKPRSCISFDSYIKPQQCLDLSRKQGVVYLLTPTSNHNVYLSRKVYPMLYIFWLLHQTTTSRHPGNRRDSCISFDSYIKPQRIAPKARNLPVVYLLTPTSNHNLTK